ncbi:hypothetical protein [Paenibacillus cineris]|uniref:hypothetical protein n=1 Tax=Paenibacillus cineris TaxID=237530 RepID=UPI001BB3E6EB|nr:hypothetical protein [Paenibacillus cineris]
MSLLSFFKRLLGSGSASGDNSKEGNKGHGFDTPIPPYIGINKEIQGLSDLVIRLENALGTDYMEHVKQRVMERHPISQAQYQWMLLEVKRFFLMCAILKQVPMFSKDADLIWHEMLMFTRDYDRFCTTFAGRFIHHQPNVAYTNNKKLPEEERARYDLIYSMLFHIYPANEALLNPFFQFKIDEEFFQTFDNLNDQEIRSRYFQSSSDAAIEAIQLAIIGSIRKHYRDVKSAKPGTLRASRPLPPRSGRGQSSGIRRSEENGVTVDPFSSILFLTAMDTDPWNDDDPSGDWNPSDSDPSTNPGVDDSGLSPDSDSPSGDDSGNSSCSSSNDSSCSSSSDSSCSSSSCSSSSCSSCGGGGD